jgi:hypothetical protein
MNMQLPFYVAAVVGVVGLLVYAFASETADGKQQR